MMNRVFFRWGKRLLHHPSYSCNTSAFTIVHCPNRWIFSTAEKLVISANDTPSDDTSGTNTNSLPKEKPSPDHRDSAISSSKEHKAITGKNRKVGKSRHKRPLSSKYYPSPSAFEVNSIPYADAFDLDGIMSDPNLKHRYQLFSVDDDNLLRVAIQISPHDLFRINTDIKELFVFSDGVVVFWNWSRPEQDQILDFLDKHVEGEVIDFRIRSEQEETMPFVPTYDNRPSHVGRERIMLNIDWFSDEPDSRVRRQGPIYERFAFSHAMAASVKIGVWESKLDDMDHKITECIKKLKQGKIHWSTKEALQRIGDFVDIRHSMQSTELLSDDFYWERVTLLRIYKQLYANLCLRHRQTVMNKRLDYCEEMAKTIHTTLHTNYSHNLEWGIILLIVLEVALFVGYELNRGGETKSIDVLNCSNDTKDGQAVVLMKQRVDNNGE